MVFPFGRFQDQGKSGGIVTELWLISVESSQPHGMFPNRPVTPVKRLRSSPGDPRPARARRAVPPPTRSGAQREKARTAAHSARKPGRPRTARESQDRRAQREKARTAAHSARKPGPPRTARESQDRRAQREKARTAAHSARKPGRPRTEQGPSKNRAPPKRDARLRNRSETDAEKGVH